MKVTDEDKKMIKALKFVLDSGSFSLKWREAIAFGATRKWVDELEKRFHKKDKEIKITEPVDDADF